MSGLSPSQQPTVLFSIYQNNTWTTDAWSMRRSIRRPSVLYWRLSDFNTMVKLWFWDLRFTKVILVKRLKWCEEFWIFSYSLVPNTYGLDLNDFNWYHIHTLEFKNLGKNKKNWKVRKRNSFQPRIIIFSCQLYMLGFL